MVIGYGFGDGHINQLIHEAWEKGGKTLSISSFTRTVAILRKINPTYGKPIYCPGPLEEIVRVYNSTRPLRTTFDSSDSVSTISSCNMRRASEVGDDLLDAQACVKWTTDRLPALEESINSWLKLNVVVE